jgi:hypothetical protein
VVGVVVGVGLVVTAPAAGAEGVVCSQGVSANIRDVPSALGRLDAERAWTLATGRGVLVAVVDSGVSAANAHLGAAVVGGTDIVAPGGDGRTDVAGHGTAIAGEIAARPLAVSGVVGLAKDASILPVRVFSSQVLDIVGGAGAGAGGGAGEVPVTTARIAAGIRYAALHGAVIINVSLSSTTDDPELKLAVESATAGHALVVASAGNRATTTATQDSPRYPAAYPGVLSVTAVDDKGQSTDDSIHGAHVGVAAPGKNVLTAYFDKGDCLLATDKPSSSFATAYASAAAALVAERFPKETPAQWEYRLEVTASRPVLGKRDDLIGWGVIRPYEALAFVDDGSAPGPPDPQHRTGPAVGGPSSDLTVGVRPDPLAPARGIGAWWVLGGATALLGVLVASQLTARRRRSRPALPTERPVTFTN